jgi:hypothetical protein
MAERRYRDEEVREIFSVATTGDAREQSPPVEPGGLTLQELQRIAEEAGIDPARVAQAASSLDVHGKADVRRSFGVPTTVSRVVVLPRAPTDHEWELLVAEFRNTFGVKGQTTGSGGLREWSHGYLNVCVEKTVRGDQLRMSTRRDDGPLFNAIGIGMTTFAAILSAALAAGGKPAKALGILVIFGGIGLSFLGVSQFMLRLPRWARARERQMETIAEVAVKLLSNP